LGYIEQGGSFSILKLKTIQAVISLVVFLLIDTCIFQEKLQWSHILAFELIVLVVFLAFKKW
jgi:uncharacterized protein (DUF486 family)